MSLMIWLLDRVEPRLATLHSAWYRCRFLALEKARHRSIELGKGVDFYVRVIGRGRGTVRVGDRTKFGFRLARIGSGEILLQARTPEAEITIGQDNWFNNSTVLCAMRSIRIGNRCLIGDFAAIYDADFHEINPDTRHRNVGVIKPVNIGDNVWIGSRVMILKGVTIGENSVIGAMSVVSTDIPSNCVAAGIPAKVIRKIE